MPEGANACVKASCSIGRCRLSAENFVRGVPAHPHHPTRQAPGRQDCRPAAAGRPRGGSLGSSGGHLITRAAIDAEQVNDARPSTCQPLRLNSRSTRAKIRPATCFSHCKMSADVAPTAAAGSAEGGTEPARGALRSSTSGSSKAMAGASGDLVYSAIDVDHSPREQFKSERCGTPVSIPENSN